MFDDTRAIHITIALTVLCRLATLPAPATAQSTTQPGFTVAFDERGDAVVTLTLTYDLTTDAERSAFERLQTNESARERLATQYGDRLRGVARSAANATGRTMTVPGVTATLRTEGETGVAELSARWTALAARENGSLVVSEPFATGFATEARFVVEAPDGYVISSTTPAADTRGEGRAVWNGTTALDGFRTVLAPEKPSSQSTPTDRTERAGGEGSSPSGSSADGPGFGLMAGGAAVLLLGLLGLRSSRGDGQ